MPKVEIKTTAGRSLVVDQRIADYLERRGRATYATRDLRAQVKGTNAPVVPKELMPEAVTPEPVKLPEEVVPKTTVSTEEAKARREASKRK